MMQLQGAICFIGTLLWFQRITAVSASQPYHLVHKSLTWYEAQRFCRVKYTDLATVNNMGDENKLIHTLGSHVTHTWIGLHRGSAYRWMWSDGSGRVDFSRWNEGEPNDAAGIERCGEMSDTSSWNDILCEDSLPVVCYERRYDGMERYVYYSHEQSWVNSQELCRDKHTDLAYARTERDNSEIASLPTKWPVWIGLFKDTWMWSDGSETSFRYWLRGVHYSGDCASVAGTQQGRWVEDNCNNKATFVCQGGLKVKKMIIRMKVLSDVALTDSTVSDALLQKFETALKRQGVTDFNPSWRADKHGFVFRRQKLLEVTEKTDADC